MASTLMHCLPVELAALKLPTADYVREVFPSHVWPAHRQTNWLEVFVCFVILFRTVKTVRQQIPQDAPNVQQVLL